MRKRPTSDSTAIAIIGLGCLYPDARNVEQFWDNIVRGVDSMRDIPRTHWSVADHYDPDPSAPDKTYSKRGGFIPEVPFDPVEFGMPPKVLEFTDVLQLLSLLVAKQTLADAGCQGAGWFDRSRTGVVLGVTGSNSIIQPLSARLQTPVLKQAARSCGLSDRQADEIAARYAKAFVPWEENAFPGLLGNVVAGRIANRFDLGGINCTVDAACASSLAAVRMAVDELLAGRADLMLTGGCDADNSILMYMCFAKTPALSRSDMIRPFDEDGDGTLIGEGIGMLALKRLADAERDGDRIYSVLRGLGSSSDGRHKSIYAPRGEGQIVALRRAYDDAGFGPEQVGLLEAHGTGTPVGDLTEVTALHSVYAGAARHSVAIGSVKSQIGHTKGAAGAAGMIKLSLSLYHKVLPPTINVRRPRQALGFDDGPFYVNTESRPWIAQPERALRRAGVSSFGFGGTNFHCVLEEHQPTSAEATAGHATAQVHLWHAATAENLLAAIPGPPASADDGVPADDARIAIVARGTEELDRLRTEAVARLRADPAAESFELPQGIYYRRGAAHVGKVAALFAGQGSQYAGMGAWTAMAVPQVRAAFDAAAACCEGESLGSVVFPPPAFDEKTAVEQDNALRRTDFAQPAIGALAAGQFRYLTALGFAPDAALGHSFGELTALWAAQCLSDADFHRLAAARGRAMARRPADLPDPGTMAVVYASPARVADLLAGHPDVVVCNHNTPDQVVVGGGTDAVGEFVGHCAGNGVTARLLPVAAAFHTRYVAHAADEFAAELSDVEFREPRISVLSNTVGAEYGDDHEVNRGVLAKQLAQPVSFAPRLQQLYDDGIRVFVEFGPKPVLAGLTTRTLGDRPGVHVLSADPGPGRDGDLALKQLVARLVVLGLPLKGFGHEAAATDVATSRKGMAIPLNGTNHVPPERRTEHQEMLRDGPIAGSERPAVPMGRLAAEHLDAHREYLSGQLRIAERISAVMHDEARNGVRDRVIAGITTIAEHSMAISRSHGAASEALRSLAQLEAGLPVSPPMIDVIPEPRVLTAGTYMLAPPAHSPSETSTVESSTVESAKVHQPVATPSVPAPDQDDSAIREQLLKIVSSKTGYPVEMLDGGMEIEADLGIDSIKRVEIMSALRDRFPTTAMASAEELAELRVLDNIVDFVAAGQEAGTGPKAEGGLGVARSHVRLSPLPSPGRVDRPFRERPIGLVAGEDPALTEVLAATLTAQGWTVHSAASLPSVVSELDLVLYVPGRPADLGAASGQLSEALLLATRTQAALESVAGLGRTAFVTVTRRFDDVAGAALGGVSGLVRTLAIEAPSLFCRAIDVDAELDDRRVADFVLAELHDPNTSRTDVSYDDAGVRHGIVLDDAEPVPAEGSVLDRSDLLVVTGGGRGVTAACVMALARRYQPGLLLVGRTRITDEHRWADEIPADQLRTAVADRLTTPSPRAVESACQDILAQREVTATLAAVRQAGAEADYLAVDVTDPAAVDEALRPYRHRITGLVHGAGILVDQLITRKQAAGVDRVLGTKLGSLQAILANIDTDRLRHIVLFSSVAGLFGNRGQADYAMANEALNRTAAVLKRANPTVRVAALNWGAWDGGMVTPELARMFAQRGVPLIPADIGAQLFVEQFHRPLEDEAVCLLGPAVPLSGPRRVTLPHNGLRIVRELAPLLGDRLVTNHSIDGRPVLPATAALGAILHVVAEVLPSTVAPATRDFAVFKGIVFDHEAPKALTFHLVAQDDGVRVTVSDERGRPRYGAVVDVGTVPEPRRTTPPALEGGEQITPYTTGALFHGPDLRGIHRLLADDEQGSTFLCELADSEVAGGGWSTETFRPILTDLLLQAPLVWLHRHLGIRALPSRIGRVVTHRALPDRTKFAVEVHGVQRTESGARCAVTAIDSNGNHLVELQEVELVGRQERALWDEQDLHEFATGEVAKVFGPAFAEVDGYARRLRLPAPPYLLLSRVIALNATTGSYQPSSIVVEYDVPEHNESTVDGRALFGPTLEVAQASVLLIGYLGIDWHNQGDRMFRLLGGSYVFHGDLPRPGETLRYELAITQFVWQGPKLLFHFTCRAYRGDTLFLEMVDNCAGFFTEAELAQPLGILPATIEVKRLPGSVFTPLAHTTRESLSRKDLQHLAAGDPAEVFGVDWDQSADGLNSSVRLPKGHWLVLDEVTEMDRTGGPSGLGMLAATQRITPGDWYFRCHFPDDPVLPATVMIEGAAQLLQVFAMSLGLHLVFPDAEFQPSPAQRTFCSLRGQVTPRTGYLRYTAEITSISMLPRPTVTADVVVHDGDTPIMHLRDLSLQVREKPGTPFAIGPGGRPERFLGRRNRSGQPSVANEFHMTHLAQGDLSVAMGPEFARYADRLAPRIPNSEFRFLDRLMEFTGERGQLSGVHMTTEYDSPADAWYYHDNGNGEMPYCVLMETSLQSAVLTGYYLGATLLTPDEDLVIRNLEGKAVLLRAIDLRGRTIRQESELLSTQQVLGTTLQRFRYRLAADGEDFYQGESLFGYFSASALARQSGLDGGRRVPPLLDAGAERLPVADDDHWPGRLALLDHVDVARSGGRYGLGHVRAQRRISADDWYFSCHFHGDPVMPGSLGVQSVIQALQAFALHSGLTDGLRSPRFTLPAGVPMEWRYRGQILPSDHELVLELHVKQIRDDRLIIADASVWNGDLRIYEVTDLAVGLREGTG